MRRTLALAGAAVLALGTMSLAGPAAADSGAGTANANGVFLNEIAAELDPGSVGIAGGFIELVNGDENPADVSGWTLIACSVDKTFDVVIPANTTIPAGGVYLVGDSEFAAVGFNPQQFNEELTIEAGGALLKDDSNDLIDEVRWETPEETCEDLDEAGLSPTSDESINRDGGSWILETPSPGLS